MPRDAVSRTANVERNGRGEIFTYKRNKNGPRIEPCGMSIKIILELEYYLLLLIYYLLILFCIYLLLILIILFIYLIYLLLILFIIIIYYILFVFCFLNC